MTKRKSRAQPKPDRTLTADELGRLDKPAQYNIFQHDYTPAPRRVCRNNGHAHIPSAGQRC